MRKSSRATKFYVPTVLVFFVELQKTPVFLQVFSDLETIIMSHMTMTGVNVPVRLRLLNKPASYLVASLLASVRVSIIFDTLVLTKSLRVYAPEY